MSIGVFIPTLGRPHALQRAADNVHLATKTPHTIVFVVDPDDGESRDAAVATGELTLVYNHEPCFAGKLQTAYEATTDEFILAGNDDFDFQQGWDTIALDAMNGVDVVGIFDGRGTDATMFIRRSYIDEIGGVIDMPPGRLYYPYSHNFCDTEFRETATTRGRYKSCPESVILHMHPDFGLAELDETYKKSRATFNADAAIFISRRYLW